MQCDILGLKVSVLYLAFKEQALVVQTLDMVGYSLRSKHFLARFV